MKTKKIIALVSVLIILAAGTVAAVYGYTNYRAANIEVTQNEDGSYTYARTDNENVASIIVEENVEEANAVNNVAAIVFDFRGYDTLGESFILLTAIAGSFVILARSKKVKKEENGDEI